MPLACKSRICPRCGKAYTDKWVDELVGSLYAVSHRHMIFTVPEQLRDVLDADHGLFRAMMDAVSKTLKQMVNERRGAVPGIICTLHPFGKDLKLNPHVDVLVTEGGLNRRGEWVSVPYFEYAALRKIWQYHLLNAVRASLPMTLENRCLIDSLFKDYPNGFYVHAKRRVTSPKGAAKYVARYVRHPAIAESRISEFNLVTNTVTFWYDVRNEFGRKVRRERVTLDALEFIRRLVRLIPDKNLKIVRYYGLYARRTKAKLQKMLTPISREKVRFAPKLEVIKCPRCGQIMELVEISRPKDKELGYNEWDDYSSW